MAERHVEIPEQVVQVGDEVMIKVIDIDLERRRISLSLKQANEGFVPDSDFDPSLYGMAAEYDNDGNYIYPEGFDPDAGEWKPGYEKAREEWERQYSEAYTRYEKHLAQVAKARQADAEAAAAEAAGGSSESADEEQSGGGDYSSSSSSSSSASSAAEEQSSGQQQDSSGSLASDAQLAALREKLSGGA